MQQELTFDKPDPRARNTDPRTSHEAARKMIGAAKGQRSRIYHHLLEHGPMTADEIDEALGLRVTSAGRRLPELREVGAARMLEETRTTRSGVIAHLWVAIPLS